MLNLSPAMQFKLYKALRAIGFNPARAYRRAYLCKMSRSC